MADYQCYNISCGQTYKEQENHDTACQYHPGKPYFHDGYKEWTCCKMRSRDFSVFMGFKGCTKGRHNNVKPEESSKQQVEISSNSGDKLTEELNVTNHSTDGQANVSLTPPDPNLLETIPILEAVNLAASPPPPPSIKICKNCKKEESTLKTNEPCHYHKGVQIFHDAYKYWSCCQHKKFSDFEDFQKLPPCAKADRHELIVKIEYKENWFQTGTSLTIALYGLKGARNMDDHKSMVKLKGGKKLFVHLVNAEGVSIFEKEWNLLDYVVANQSKVNINPSNVQIILKKLNEKFHWPTLEEKVI